ncbi:hypothetical protein [Arthrobacter globiformis]|uniref:hypothetical protein n=1 Tax=Arthrobacter globiformis TaxID=1665 RepID=UPI002790457B|nr:hypothetical protein [Arthrobacter globiformis]MDQ0617086.1 hypothetical protein [Arthrobacter globiformis]
MTMTEMLTRMRAALAEALLFPPIPATAEQANDALQDVTRWAWLPPLSGVAVAADHAHRTHPNAGGKAAEQAEKTN